MLSRDAKRLNQAVLAGEGGLDRQLNVVMIVSLELFHQRLQLTRFAGEMLQLLSAKDGVLRRLCRRHLVEKALERGAEIVWLDCHASPFRWSHVLSVVD